ncbi:hypothetical protein [Microbacterium sp. SS28]|uniref:hypothetical protein n=1 Tax=Microbacterium sp. SS28 TaxID=2919948 RepID=UPI001FA99648|nr:hypothetical protein [Microbacterium sp. SS28]
MNARSRVGAALVTAVIMMGGAAAVGGSAAAAPTATAAVRDFSTGNTGDSSFVLEYGATTPASRLITIGPDTRTIVFAPGFGPQGDEIACNLLAADGSLIAERYWSSNEWWSPPYDRTLTVPTGAVAGVGEAYTASCAARAEASYLSIWNLVGAGDAGAQLTLDESPAKATRTTEREPLDGARDATGSPVALGDRVRISGPAGIWFPPGSTPVLDVRLEVSVGGGTTTTGPAEDVEATVDGAVLSFTIPRSLPAKPGDDIVVRAESTSTVPGSNTAPDRVTTRIWVARLAVESATTASTTGLTLDRRYGVSTLSAGTARVVVTDPLGGPIAGSVVLVIDGKSRPPVVVSGVGSVSTTIRLPKLGRGLHTIVATFGGSESLSSSTSPARQVRILL